MVTFSHTKYTKEQQHVFFLGAFPLTDFLPPPPTCPLPKVCENKSKCVKINYHWAGSLAHGKLKGKAPMEHST